MKSGRGCRDLPDVRPRFRHELCRHDCQRRHHRHALRCPAGKNQESYSKHIIFFVSYESAQYARLLHNNVLERLCH
jgi:hypothetical protein